VPSDAPKVDTSGAVARQARRMQQQQQPNSLANIPNVLPPRPGQAQPQQPAAPTTGAGTRGFIIEVICTTPRADAGSFVLNNFVNKLGTMKSSNPAVNYATKFVEEPLIQSVGTVAAGQVGRPNNAVVRLPGALGGGPPVLPGALGGQAAAPGAEQPKFDPNEDPVTKENMSSDQRVTIRMMVQLDPPKSENHTASAQ
jgi:hypothetical protein